MSLMSICFVLTSCLWRYKSILNFCLIRSCFFLYLRKSREATTTMMRILKINKIPVTGTSQFWERRNMKSQSKHSHDPTSEYLPNGQETHLPFLVFVAIISKPVFCSTHNSPGRHEDTHWCDSTLYRSVPTEHLHVMSSLELFEGRQVIGDVSSIMRFAPPGWPPPRIQHASTASTPRSVARYGDSVEHVVWSHVSSDSNVKHDTLQPTKSEQFSPRTTPTGNASGNILKMELPCSRIVRSLVPAKALEWSISIPKFFRSTVVLWRPLNAPVGIARMLFPETWISALEDMSRNAYGSRIISELFCRAKLRSLLEYSSFEVFIFCDMSE